MRKKPKTDPSDTIAPCDGVQGGADVWADPDLEELGELTDKLLKVPKTELEKLEAERPKRKRTSSHGNSKATS